MSDLKNIGRCCKCGCHMALPSDLYAAARRDERITVYCAHGHPQVFRAGESDEDILRRERDLLKQRLAQKDDAISVERQMRETAERRVSAARGQVTRLKNRAGAGVCPCCNRSFVAFARHMAMKHPQFRAEEIPDGATVQ